MAQGGTLAIKFEPPTLVVAIPAPRGGYTIKTCVFRDIEPGAHAMDLMSFLGDEGFLAGLEAISEARLMAYLTALIERKAPLAPRKPSAPVAMHESTSWSDDNEFGQAGAAAELQASGPVDDLFDADGAPRSVRREERFRVKLSHRYSCRYILARQANPQLPPLAQEGAIAAIGRHVATRRGAREEGGGRANNRSLVGEHGRRGIAAGGLARVYRSATSAACHADDEEVLELSAQKLRQGGM